MLRLRATATASTLLLTMLAVSSCSGSSSDAPVAEPATPSANSSLLPEEAALLEADATVTNGDADGFGQSFAEEIEEISAEGDAATEAKAD